LVKIAAKTDETKI